MYFNIIFRILRTEIKTAYTVTACQTKQVFGWNVPEAEILNIDIICTTSMSWAGGEELRMEGDVRFKIHALVIKKSPT